MNDMIKIMSEIILNQFSRNLEANSNTPNIDNKKQTETKSTNLFSHSKTPKIEKREVENSNSPKLRKKLAIACAPSSPNII